jgi:hypothetical protein
MANSIQEQSSSLVNGQDTRMDARASIADLESQKQEADFASISAKHRQENFQRIAQYNQSGAEQQKIQGNTLVTTGNIKVATGFGQIMMGGVMMAMAGIPGAGPAMLSQGLTMLVKGATDVGMGMADTSQGNVFLALAEEALNEAVNNNTLSKQEGIVVHKEKTRSEILEYKKELMQQLAEVVLPMLEKAGIRTEDVNEDQLAKFMDKFSEDAGKCLANDGIMEVNLEGANREGAFKDVNGNELNGTFHFIRDEKTKEFYKVELVYDEKDNVAKGALGEPLLDTSKGMVKVEDGDLKDYLELKFLFVDKFKLLAKGLTFADTDANGNIRLIPYDTNNREHMEEFADLIKKTNFKGIASGEITAPRKYSSDEQGGFFQEWDWDKDIPLGPKVYISEIYGETKDMRSDIDNYQIALERTDRALQTLGMQSGGNVFGLLSSSGNTSLSPKAKPTESRFLQITARDSGEFASYRNVSSTIDALRSQNNILESSTGDDLPEGQA